MSKEKRVSGTRILFLFLCLFTWFIGGLLYLFFCRPKGIELVVCILAIFIPIIPAILLWLNAFGIIRL